MNYCAYLGTIIKITDYKFGTIEQ